MPRALLEVLQMTVAARHQVLDTSAGRVRLNAALLPTDEFALPQKEEVMANPNDPNTEKNEMRVMWIGSVAIVLLILAAMGINMLITRDTNAGSAETSNQLGTVQPK